MSAQNEHRRLAAIMFTDLVGYSALAQRNEKLALELLAESQHLLRSQFPHYNGREVESTGDGFLVEFPSALQATECAVEIQRALAARNGAEAKERQFQIRIGIHVGDVVHREADMYGDGVNIAARIEPLARGGGICLSDTVVTQVRNKLDIRLTKLDAPEMKHIEAPLDVYRVVLPWDQPAGIQSENHPPERRADRRNHPTPVASKWLWAGALAVLAGGLGWWLLDRSGSGAPMSAAPPRTAAVTAPATTGTSPRNSVAVLPFVCLSANKADEYLSDGMTEELLNALGKVPGLRVPGRTSCFNFKGNTDEGLIRKVGDQLRVRTVLEGSVRKDGEKLRITAQLVNVDDGLLLWSDNYDRSMQDILAVQVEVAQQVVQALKVELGVEARRALAKTSTTNPEAHRLYMLGRHYALKVTDEDNEKAIEYFHQALKLDPGYARAYAGLADTWDLRLPPKEMVSIVRSHAEAALKIDPELAEAHCSIAWILLSSDWDFAGAEREFARAIQLQPNLAWAHDGYGWPFMFVGRFDEAEAAFKKAVDLDPRAAYTNTDLAMLYRCTGQFDKAVEYSRQAIDLDSRHPWAYHNLGWSLLLQGKPSEAVSPFEQLQKLGENPNFRMDPGCAYAALGDRAKAEAVIKELEDMARHRYVPAWTQGYIWLYLNERDRAFDLLERSVAERDPNCIWFNVDPALDSLRNEPRFQALLSQIGFPNKR